MNKNIEPGKTLWYLRDGMGYLWLALIKRKKTFRRLVVASGRRGERGFQVYPRACGGTLILTVTSPSTLGLSPRVRGNLHLELSDISAVRSIPANLHLVRGNPRACRWDRDPAVRAIGSIPARAGKP